MEEIIELLENGDITLSEALRQILEVAKEKGYEELEEFCKNELEGYENSVSIPEYRKVLAPCVYFDGKLKGKEVESEILSDNIVNKVYGEDALLYSVKWSVKKLEKFEDDDDFMIDVNLSNYNSEIYELSKGKIDADKVYISVDCMMVSDCLDEIEDQLFELVDEILNPEENNKTDDKKEKSKPSKLASVIVYAIVITVIVLFIYFKFFK